MTVFRESLVVIHMLLFMGRRNVMGGENICLEHLAIQLSKLLIHGWLEECLFLWDLMKNYWKLFVVVIQLFLTYQANIIVWEITE